MEGGKRKSVYLYGAEYGRYFGLYLILLSACLMASPHVPLLLFVMAVLLPGFPILLYLFLRRMCTEAPYTRTFAGVWMAGIMTTLCGSLICAVVTALWLTYVEPDFFVNYMQSAINTLHASGQADEYGEQIQVMQKAIDSKTLPSPMDYVLSMCWSTVFLGSIVSMLCAWILVVRYRRRLFNTP